MTRSVTKTNQLLGRFDEPGVIDCDGYILALLHLWQNSLEPQDQERGFR
jgi:hypothetical protein